MESRLRIEADVQHLRTVRQFVEESAARLDVAPDDIYKLALAVDEMITNIIVHGYRGRPGTIEVELRPIGADLEIRLRDQSPPFDPMAMPQPDIHLPLTQRPLGGMGIYLTRNIMDQITYRSTVDQGNELTLLKKQIIHHQSEEAGDGTQH